MEGSGWRWAWRGLPSPDRGAKTTPRACTLGPLLPWTEAAAEAPAGWGPWQVSWLAGRPPTAPSRGLTVPSGIVPSSSPLTVAGAASDSHRLPRRMTRLATGRWMFSVAGTLARRPCPCQGDASWSLGRRHPDRLNDRTQGPRGGRATAGDRPPRPRPTRPGIGSPPRPDRPRSTPPRAVHPRSSPAFATGPSVARPSA